MTSRPSKRSKKKTPAQPQEAKDKKTDVASGIELEWDESDPELKRLQKEQRAELQEAYKEDPEWAKQHQKYADMAKAGGFRNQLLEGLQKRNVVLAKSDAKNVCAAPPVAGGGCCVLHAGTPAQHEQLFQRLTTFPQTGLPYSPFCNKEKERKVLFSDARFQRVESILSVFEQSDCRESFTLQQNLGKELQSEPDILTDMDWIIFRFHPGPALYLCINVTRQGNFAYVYVHCSRDAHISAPSAAAQDLPASASSSSSSSTS